MPRIVGTQLKLRGFKTSMRPSGQPAATDVISQKNRGRMTKCQRQHSVTPGLGVVIAALYESFASKPGRKFENAISAVNIRQSTHLQPCLAITRRLVRLDF